MRITNLLSSCVCFALFAVVSLLGYLQVDLAQAQDKINTTTIETYNDYGYGMYISGSGSATNFGTVITHGGYAFGMYADSNTSALNETAGKIITYGIRAYGMHAYGSSSHITNKGEITTSNQYAYGMSASSGAAAENWGTITTSGIYAYGMYATVNSSVQNCGTITTGKKDDSTYGNTAYGMYAYNNSQALNEGVVITYGNDACGMLVHTNSRAENQGTVATMGTYAFGMYAKTSSVVENCGTITTGKEDNSTYGNTAYGMYAYNNSRALNEDGGTIKTFGSYACGMLAQNTSSAKNFGDISTTGNYAYGMYAHTGSRIENQGIITTGKEGSASYGNNAYGMYAYSGSYAVNAGTINTLGNNACGMASHTGSKAENLGTITTSGIYAYGMYASTGSSTAYNNGDVSTTGNYAYGMYASNNSTITNESTGFITTYGKLAHGMYADDSSTVTNESGGTITTYGKEAHGMYLYDSIGTNSGSIIVTGEGADAAYINSSTFTNSGTLDSLHGNAITSVNSTVNLNDGTKLVNSHVIQGDDASTLNVEMDEDIAATIRGFKKFTNSGKGTVIFESGSSVPEVVNKGTLKIAPDTTFETNSYTQTAEASLHLYVPSNPNVGPPLKINNEGGTAAQFAGNIIIDYSSQPLPGMYKYIYVAGEKTTGNFDKVFFVNPDGIYVEEEPQWVKGNSWSYVGNVAVTGSSGTDGHIYVGYSFSEQALGLVSAIEDWSLLRWIMANHVQDVTSNIHDLKIGQKEYYAHFFANKTDRNPSGKSPLGYESDTKGISFGFDKKVDDKTIWGIYAGYTEKDIDFTDVVPASSDWEEQDSWHIGAYMSKRFDKWIISDTLTYRTTDHDSFRRQADGDARASFDSWAVTNDICAGYAVKEIGKDSHWEIVPEIGLNVGYFNRDGYSETNGYTYGDYDTTITEGVIGIRFRGEFVSNDSTRFSPYLRLSYVNVLSGDDVTIDETRYGKTRWFTEELDDDYFVADLGMTLYSAGNFDMSLSYNGRFGDNTDSHGGWLRLEWKQ